MSAATSDLRPWTVGELIDRSASFWRRRVKQLFQLMLGFQLVIFVVQKAYLVLGQRYYPALLSVRAVTEAQEGGSDELLRQLAVGLSAAMVLFTFAVVLSWCGNLVLNRFIVDDIVSSGGDRAKAFARLRKRFGALVGAFFVVHLWAAIVFALSALPGLIVIALGVFSGSRAGMLAAIVVGYIAIFFGMLAATLWYFLRFMLVPTVLAVEERGVWATIKRSGELVSGRIGPRFLDRVFIRATIVLSVIFIVLFVVLAVLGAPAGLIQIIFGNILDPQNATPESVPQLLLIPAELIEAVGAAVLMPISSVLAALFYLDMRMRREGLDLELKLNAIEAAKA